MRLKQRIVRILIREIIAEVEEKSREGVLLIHWAGGRHSEVRVKKSETGRSRRCTDPKAIEVIRLLTEAGAQVPVMMTPEATRFVTPLTLEALSNHPVAADWLNAQGAGESHIALAEWGELIAIVPATLPTFFLALAITLAALGLLPLFRPLRAFATRGNHGQ